MPGSWEGDLIIGKGNLSAIGTLVERSSNYTMLVALPDGYKPEQVASAVGTEDPAASRPAAGRVDLGSGTEMRDWEKVRIDTGIEIFFCDPKSPWQRGINENTNGLLRQYFPKGTELAGFTEEHLDAVAAELNDRPRKRLRSKPRSKSSGTSCCDDRQNPPVPQRATELLQHAKCRMSGRDRGRADSRYRCWSSGRRLGREPCGLSTPRQRANCPVVNWIPSWRRDASSGQPFPVLCPGG